MNIGLGGGCHWCTEGIFQSLKGVTKVDQGWISGEIPHENYSEAILIEFDENIISLDTIIEIHLLTHSSEAAHSFRNKYRSAIYFFDEEQFQSVTHILIKLSEKFKKKFITRAIRFKDFKLNKADQLDYFYTRPEAPFCETYIIPKIKMLINSHSDVINTKALNVIDNYC
ncbi:peptide-methionine (S)-S-oxide reductase [Mangrovivirga cuniculi]|uniref:peptide-methionine (S)-S-oxide reductase n=1 Tax=Mangrovivirga cuniculi TaxID=2715131 RepID=A0A4D7JTD9_9BACT|nr:peptide-methionine (S)-S-oxide reductase [Mangrovivirga cuniculi]QCK16790.1 peptide methionine sulfoxide reductase [Mangrovivirga cuniculi]